MGSSTALTRASTATSVGSTSWSSQATTRSRAARVRSSTGTGWTIRAPASSARPGAGDTVLGMRRRLYPSRVWAPATMAGGQR